ncbi:hypothetical protein QBA75_23285 [Streptomyces stelliscabiei]
MHRYVRAPFALPRALHRISRYSDEFFAVVLSADRTAGGLQLIFASAGDSTPRSPRTSCLNQGGAQEYAEDVRLERSDTTLNHFHYGAMNLPPGAPGSSFTYSCATTAAP